MMKLLNWLNGTREKRVPSQAKWGRQTAINPLPQGEVKPRTYLETKALSQTRPLSEKMLEEYRKGRDMVIGEFKHGRK